MHFIMYFITINHQLTVLNNCNIYIIQHHLHILCLMINHLFVIFLKCLYRVIVKPTHPIHLLLVLNYVFKSGLKTCEFFCKICELIRILMYFLYQSPNKDIKTNKKRKRFMLCRRCQKHDRFLFIRRKLW